MTPAEWFVALSAYTLAFGLATCAALAWPRKEDQ